MEKTNKNIGKIITKSFDGNQGSFIAKIAIVEETYEEISGSVEANVENLDVAILCDEKTNLNGVEGVEGQLLISATKKLDASVDLNGNLLISGEGINSYEVNEMGELIFNK